jgi:hypothetical protein
VIRKLPPKTRMKRVFASSPAEFANHIAAETEKWGKLIRAASIKPD